jgi:hypothetical protein
MLEDLLLFCRQGVAGQRGGHGDFSLPQQVIKDFNSEIKQVFFGRKQGDSRFTKVE